MTKKMIKTSYSIVYDLEGTIDEAIAFLQNLKQQHPEGVLSLEYDAAYEDHTLCLVYEREETDKEYNIRLKVEKERKAVAAKVKAHIEKHERDTLAKLKKKYEKS